MKSVHKTVLLIGYNDESIEKLRTTNAFSDLKQSQVHLKEVITMGDGSPESICTMLEASCAAVFVLTHEALEHESFRIYIAMAAQEACNRVGFRLYLLFDDIDQSTFFELETKYPRTVSAIKMSVHVSGIRSSEKIMNLLLNHIRSVDSLNEQFDKHLHSLRKRSTLFWWANRIQDIGFGAGMLLLAVRGNFQVNNDGVIVGDDATLVMIMIGMGASISLQPILCLLTWGRRVLDISSLKKTILPHLLALGLVIWMCNKNPGDISWVCVGFLFHLMTDQLVRGNAKSVIELASLAPRAYDVFDNESISRSCEAVEPHAHRAAQGQSEFHQHCPLLPRMGNKTVFISYSHHGEWGERTARELATFLKENDIPHFLDHQVIPEGGAWKFWVFSGIHECGLFVLLLDENSARSSWAAAETEFALRSVYKVASPLVTVVIEKDYLEASENRQSTLPIFHAVCRRLFGETFGTGERNLSAIAPIGVVDSDGCLDQWKEMVKIHPIPLPGLIGPSLGDMLFSLRHLPGHLSALTVAVATFMTYLLIFSSSESLFQVLIHWYSLIVSALMFALGYQIRSSVIVSKALREGTIRLPIWYALFVRFGFLFLLIPFFRFWPDISLPSQIIACMMTFIGWQAQSYSSGEKFRVPVWSFVTQKK